MVCAHTEAAAKDAGSWKCRQISQRGWGWGCFGPLSCHDPEARRHPHLTVASNKGQKECLFPEVHFFHPGVSRRDVSQEYTFHDGVQGYSLGKGRSWIRSNNSPLALSTYTGSGTSYAGDTLWHICLGLNYAPQKIC